MSAALGDQDPTIFNLINQTIFSIDPSAAIALKIPFECFRFTDTDERTVPFNIFDKLIDTFQCFSVFCLPIEIIVPSFI